MTMKRARGGGEAERASAAGQGRSDGGREGGGRLVATRGRSGYNTHGVRTGKGRSGVAWEEAADGWSQDPGGNRNSNAALPTYP